MQFFIERTTFKIFSVGHHFQLVGIIFRKVMGKTGGRVSDVR